jgi:hypothetical protein
VTRLWAITAYFNPARFNRRLANYRMFREYLPVPLVTVELAHGPDFELGDGDADILVQLRGTDVMWQKERLLNVALSHLPGSCRRVIWIDCDVIVETADWADRVDRLLDGAPLVQAFGCAFHLPSAWNGHEPGPALFTQPSVVKTIASGTEPAEVFASRVPSGPGSTNKGLAWAADRALLEAHGFYDACVVGGGDLALACAAYGCFDAATRTMNARQRDHYMAWAGRWHAAMPGAPACLDDRVLHLWHGDIHARRYRERHDGLAAFRFDPSADIAHDVSGCWRWNSDKPDLQQYVRDYFVSRREDG